MSAQESLETPAAWAQQILEQPWGRLVADSMSRTLSYVPNDRPRQLAGYLLPLANRADALERELRKTTELLTAIGQWLASAGDYGTSTASAVDKQVIANNKALDGPVASD